MAWRLFTKRQKIITILITIIIFFVYIVIIVLSIDHIGKKQLFPVGSTIEKNIINAQNITSLTFSQKTPANVLVGTYIDSIDSLSIKDSNWVVTFYIWFSWSDKNNINPGKNFEVVNGTIEKKTALDKVYSGNKRLEIYLVKAKINKFFDTYRIPLDGHTLTICIEDGIDNELNLRYVADPESTVSSRVVIPGYKILNNIAMIKFHKYTANFGRINKVHEIYSQYVLNTRINRIDYGVYIKIFLSLIAAQMLVFVSFLLNMELVGTRFTLVIGAFYGAVANSYISHSLIPYSGTFGLIDIITLLGILTIFIVILVTTYSYYLFNQKHGLIISPFFDRCVGSSLFFCCVFANIIIPYLTKN